MLPAAKQLSFKPPTEALIALLGAAQTSGTPPEARVAIMIGPLRVCSTRGSTPYFRTDAFFDADPERHHGFVVAAVGNQQRTGGMGRRVRERFAKSSQDEKTSR